MTDKAETPLALPLKRVLDEKDAKRLERALSVQTVGELLAHLPRRYAKRGEHTRIADLVVDEYATVVATVISCESNPMRNRRGSLTKAVIGDGRDTLQLTFFNQPWRVNELTPGAVGMFSGKVGSYGTDLQLTQPDYRLLADDEDAVAAAADWGAGRLLPIYPATAKVRTWDIAEQVQLVLERVPELPDPVPEQLRYERGELSFDAAVRAIHHPEDEQQLAAAQQALRFTEALELQTVIAQQRASNRARVATRRVRASDGLTARFDAALPFALTGDQQRVGETIAHDLAADAPMYRMLQGEVGSGKTLVAVRAMLQVAESGGQSALLAPTEVLAGQHLRSIQHTLGPELTRQLGVRLLTGSLGRRERQRTMLDLVTGDAKIVVGTHALLSEGVEFADLGLVVVDEQHRFGVEQRETLRRKGGAAEPHTLVLTATPIPRTVAMTVFGDLEVSTLRELPAGRGSIESFVVATGEHPGWLGRVWQRTAEEIGRGRQAFVVCPAIDPAEVRAEAGEGRPIANVVEVLEYLQRLPEFASMRLAPLHGAMDAAEKDLVMREFAAGDIDLLVATTVIEVGVNVPNASVMVVLDADRFGVSQLHQLRGRVGRGEHAGLALLVTGAPAGILARERLAAVAATLDGFELAERDLELRSEGDVLGTAQSGGVSSLRLLRVTRDTEIIAAARAEAERIVASDPTLAAHPALRDAVARLGSGERAHLQMG